MFKFKGEDCSIQIFTVTHAYAHTIILESHATNQQSLLYVTCIVHSDCVPLSEHHNYHIYPHLSWPH